MISWNCKVFKSFSISKFIERLFTQFQKLKIFITGRISIIRDKWSWGYCGTISACRRQRLCWRRGPNVRFPALDTIYFRKFRIKAKQTDNGIWKNLQTVLQIPLNSMMNWTIVLHFLNLNYDEHFLSRKLIFLHFLIFFEIDKTMQDENCQ